MLSGNHRMCLMLLDCKSTLVRHKPTLSAVKMLLWCIPNCPKELKRLACIYCPACYRDRAAAYGTGGLGFNFRGRIIQNTLKM